MKRSQSSVGGIALAAGLGTRLRPLTSDTPKPLVPFFGTNLLSVTIHKISLTSASALGVNAHFFLDQIEKHCLERKSHLSKFFDKFLLSKESPNILGTAGCYSAFKALPCEYFLAHNADILSNLDLNSFVKSALQNDGPVTMALTPKPHGGGMHVWTESDRVVHIGSDHGGHKDATPCGFIGIQMFHRSILDKIKPQSYQELVPLYQELLSQGVTIHGKIIHDISFVDIGTLAGFYTSHLDILDQIEYDKTTDKVCPDQFSIIDTLGTSLNDFIFVQRGGCVEIGTKIKIEGPSLVSRSLNSKGNLHIGPNSIVMKNVYFESEVKTSRSIFMPLTSVESSEYDGIIHHAGEIVYKAL